MLQHNGFLSSALFGALASLALAPGHALAHAQLVGAEPAADASVAAPTAITLHFNEDLEKRVSSINVADAAGHAVGLHQADVSDEKSLSAMPDAPLSPGVYTVSWTVVGDDGHPMQGNISFTVE